MYTIKEVEWRPNHGAIFGEDMYLKFKCVPISGRADSQQVSINVSVRLRGSAREAIYSNSNWRATCEQISNNMMEFITSHATVSKLLGELADEDKKKYEFLFEEPIAVAKRRYRQTKCINYELDSLWVKRYKGT